VNALAHAIIKFGHTGCADRARLSNLARSQGNRYTDIAVATQLAQVWTDATARLPAPARLAHRLRDRRV
jgi:hypothetical protein